MALADKGIGNITVDATRIACGRIVTGTDCPICRRNNGIHVSACRVAPVSKPFPYSILYYTDEFDDGGKR